MYSDHPTKLFLLAPSKKMVQADQPCSGFTPVFFKAKRVTTVELELEELKERIEDLRAYYYDCIDRIRSGDKTRNLQKGYDAIKYRLDELEEQLRVKQMTIE